MTDNEIIKALECCPYYDVCLNCPCFSFCGCTPELFENALDLINRQKATIEDLRHEIRNLECEKGQLEGTTEYLIEQAKIKGFKELAKRLKDYYIKNRIYDRPNAHTLIGFLFCQIDNLVKEREGAEK